MEEEVKMIKKEDEGGVRQKPKCRAMFHDLSVAEQEAVATRCTDEKFSTACLIYPPNRLKQLWKELEEVDGESVPPQLRFLKDALDYDTFAEKMGNMENILAVDTKIVTRLGTSHEQIGDALKTIMRLAMHKSHVSDGGALSDFLAQLTGRQAPALPFKTPYTKLIRGDRDWCDQGKYEKTINFNGQTLRVFVINWGGSQKCPFQSDSDESYHGYDYGASDVVITNVDNGKILRFSNLLPHMIKHHHFFEGLLCFYRVEPEAIIDVIGPLDPTKNYRLQSEKKVGWASSASGSGGTYEPPAKSLRSVKLSRHVVYVTKEDADGTASEIVIHPENKDNTNDDAEKLTLLGLTADDLPGSDNYVELRRTIVKHRKYEDWLQNQPPPPAPPAEEDEEAPAAVNRGRMGGGMTMIKFGPDGEPIVTKLDGEGGGEGQEGGAPPECVIF
jgi:hypothetical protein